VKTTLHRSGPDAGSDRFMNTSGWSQQPADPNKVKLKPSCIRPQFRRNDDEKRKAFEPSGIQW
jgi:hypothetical protein